MSEEQCLRSLLLALTQYVPLLYRGQIREWLLLQQPRTAQERQRGWQKYRAWKKRCGDQADRMIAAGCKSGQLGEFRFKRHYHHRAIVIAEPLLSVGPEDAAPDVADLTRQKRWLGKQRQGTSEDLTAYYVPTQFDRPALQLPFYRDVVEYAAANPICMVGEPRIVEAFRIGSMYISQFAYPKFPSDLENRRF